MGKNQNSVVVLRIRLKFWWMMPMDVKDNHTKSEQDHFQPISAQSTPFNAHIGITNVHSAYARVGLWGTPVGPKVVKNDFFFKIVPRSPGCSNKWSRLFEPYLTHISPCKFLKPLEM